MLAALLFVPAFASAQTILTVKPFPGAGQYSEIGFALAAAANGDIIEVEGINGTSAAVYPRFAIDGTFGISVTIRAADPNHRPIISGATLPNPAVPAQFAPAGGSAIELSGTVAPISIEFLEIKDATASGVRITGSAQAQFRRCWLHNCSDSTKGGGASIESSSQIEFLSCTVSTNVAGRGAGAAVFGSPVIGPSTRFIDCEFVSNSQAAFGGGIAVDDGNLVDVRGCSFTGNTALEGGAIGAFQSTLRADYCSFHSQIAIRGGALFLEQTDSLVTNSQFHDGFGISRGGALYLDLDRSQFVNCLFVQNSAAVDGGTADVVSESSPRFENCTITGNSTSNGICGGILVETESVATINSSILWGNTGSGATWQQQLAFAPAGPTIGSANVEWSDWQGGSAPAPGYSTVTCIDLDPVFATGPAAAMPPAALPDFYLDPASPCIDAGDPVLTPDGTATTDATWTTLAPQADAGQMDMGYHRNALPMPASVLSAQGTSIAVAAGGTILMDLDTRNVPPPAGATRMFVIGASVTGTHPGTPFASIIAPIAYD
jgi:hypothetical protein